MRFSVMISFLKELKEEEKNIVESYLTKRLIEELEEIESDEGNNQVEKEKEKYVITSSRVPWITEYAIRARNYLEQLNVSFAFRVILANIIKFSEVGNNEDIVDAIDILSNYASVKGKEERDYIVAEVHYGYVNDRIVYGITLRAMGPLRLLIGVSSDLDDDEELSRVSTIFNMLLQEYEDTLRKLEIKDE